MWTSLRRFILPLSVATSVLGCNITLSELQALNPQAATLEVPCRPGMIPGNVTLMAVQSHSGHIVTDEHQDELRNVAPLAAVFIQFNEQASYQNAAVMASKYGLSCPNMPDAPTSSPEPLRNKEPCSSEVSQSRAPNPNLPADVGKPPCDSSGQPKEAKKEPKRVKVCVRPPWLPKPYKDAKGQWVTVNEWAIVLGDKKVEWTNDPAHYAEEVAKNADVIFTYDDSAAPESAYYFTKDTKKLHCPGGPPKKSFDEVEAAGDMPMLSEVNAASEAKEKAAADAKKQGGGNATSGSTTTTTTAAAPKQGNGTTTSTSSPDGSGPPLDPFETAARELVFAGKLATMDTSAPATTANGSRHGMPGGKNVGGFSFPALQAGVGLATIVIGVGMKPQDFIKKVVEKTGVGKPAIVKELNADALKLADDMIKDYGQYVMAESLRKQQLIMPYKMAQKFTEKLESKFQAHKIFERRAIEEVMNKQGMSQAAIKKAVDEVAAKYPAIILSDTEHKAINKALDAAWAAQKAKVGKAGEVLTVKELREIYKKAYEKTPHWLDAIESYLR